MSTTLPLFWNLSSTNKRERIDASVKLVGALEHFQAQFTPKPVPAASASEDDEEDGGEREAQDAKPDDLDVLNAADVAYSIRRLVRGLASPRESSRLGFAVALTELLERINTVTCAQVVKLILDSAKTQGSMTGQEERDVLFARLFGITAVIQSGLLVRNTQLSPSASSASSASSFAAYQEVTAELLALGEKKSWLRESAWWTIGLAIDALHGSSVPWKEQALDSTIARLFVDYKIWTPEKIALALKLQQHYPARDWHALMSPTFKQPHVLSTGNYATLARILKDFGGADEDDDTDVSANVGKSKSGLWKPQVHFVWDALLDALLPANADAVRDEATGSFPEFFRILVDESLFSSNASPERKYWGFQIFQKALPRVQTADLPMLFTKNFMRSWINHLSKSDRYLHKAAKQVADHIQSLVKTNPTLGFTLILQLTGVHGSHQFDRLTKTKTVETILMSMNQEGIQRFIEHLLGQMNDAQAGTDTDVQALNARRAWIVEQLAALIRNGAIPKNDTWVQSILNWLAAHGLFVIKRKSEKSPFVALHQVPNPVLSEELRSACRTRLLSCLADLTAQTTLVTVDERTSKVAAVASDGQFWVCKVLSTIEQLNQDTKHVTLLSEVDEEDKTLRESAHELVLRLDTVSGERREAARGAELLLAATLLRQYCIDDEEEDMSETLQTCVAAASQMFPEEGKKSKKSRKSSGEAEDVPEPVDVLMDTVNGLLEQGTAYMRAVANQVFILLSGSVQATTIDLLLAQLERRDPGELAEDEEDEDEEMSNSHEEADDEDDEPDSDEKGAPEDDDEDLDEAENAELRKKIEDALRVNGIQAATGESDSESDEDLMDDEQMLAIDEQLAAVFKARADEKKLGKGVDAQREATHYKNRVLDLLDDYARTQWNNPFVLRMMLPLVDLVTRSGTDERQLADKAAGILRSRFGKSKRIPENVDVEQAETILRELHARARKAVSADVLNTISQGCLYLGRCVLHSAKEPILAELYLDALKDFLTRKASRLNIKFIIDFVRRFPNPAWTIRDAYVTVGDSAVNAYRRTQVFVLLQGLFSQLQSYSDRADEVYDFVTVFRPFVQKTIQDACNSDVLTTAHLKDILKSTLVGVRQSKHVLTHERAQEVWDASSWEALSETLASSQRFKSSLGLRSMCKQIVKLLDNVWDSAKSGKRKVDETAEGNGDADERAHKRRKQQKKPPPGT